jgi:class 3 adenylate cyclase
MALADDLEQEVKKTFRSQWEEQETDSVPAPEDLRLNSNHAKKLEAAVLYADIDGSTSMVDSISWQKAAEVYKSYLRCASMIIKSDGGSITAYDGDRVMGVFTGGQKRTDAVRAAMKINRAVIDIIRPAYAAQYPNSQFQLKHVIGIDSSTLHAARVGVRADNDIVWVGRAANYAAKLTALPNKPIWITGTVYDNMLDAVKYVSGSSTSQNMWTKYNWNTFDNSTVYATHFKWHSI